MYSWIWRHLPFGRPGRIVGSLVLVAVIGVAFWYGLFPRIEQFVPGTDGQVTSDNGGAGADSVDPSSGPTGAPGPDDIPYSTTSNAPEPTTSR